MRSSELIIHLRGSLGRRLSPSPSSLPHLSSVSSATGVGPLNLLHTKTRSDDEEDLLVRRPNPQFPQASTFTTACSPFTTACSRVFPSFRSRLVGIGRSSAMISFNRNYSLVDAKAKRTDSDDASQRAVTTALSCTFLVFSLKFGVWLMTSSPVILAEMVHSIADFTNLAILVYGLNSSRRAPNGLHPYGYSKEKNLWSLVPAGIYCLGSSATILHGIQNLWSSHHPEHIKYGALVIGGSFIIEGVSLLVAINAVKKGATKEGMKMWDYIWCENYPTSVSVMTEVGAAVTGLSIAAISLVAVHMTGNSIYDPIGSVMVGNLLGVVALFLVQRNRCTLIGRVFDDHDMERVLNFLKADSVVDSFYDCKSKMIGPGVFIFKAKIDFNVGVMLQNFFERTGRESWDKTFREAVECEDNAGLLKVMACHGENLVEALGIETNRLETEIQKIAPAIRHVEIEVHNSLGPLPKLRTPVGGLMETDATQSQMDPSGVCR